MQVAHVVPDVAYLKQKHGRVAQGWAAAQAATTADFAHGSWLWTHISGGLNYQVGVLRRWMPIKLLPERAPITRQLALLCCEQTCLQAQGP